MCLIALKGSRKIATVDIPVYKIVKATDNPDTWDGPYYKAGLPFDQVVEVDSPHEKNMKRLGISTVVCEGRFLHSFTSLNAAKSELTTLQNLCHDDSQYTLTRAIIPKGAIYYTDSESLEMDKLGTQAASNKLIVHRPNNPKEQSFFVKHKPDVEQPCAC